MRTLDHRSSRKQPDTDSQAHTQQPPALAVTKTLPNSFLFPARIVLLFPQYNHLSPQHIIVNSGLCTGPKQKVISPGMVYSRSLRWPRGFLGFPGAGSNLQPRPQAHQAPPPNAPGRGKPDQHEAEVLSPALCIRPPLLAWTGRCLIQ